MDSQKVAPFAEGGPGHAQYKVIEDWVADYEFEGDEGRYVPSETERTVMLDCIHGLLADDEFISLQRALYAAPVGQKEGALPALPPDMVMVPKRMTQAMQDVTDTEGWTWGDLLAAAEAITEAEHEELAAPSIAAASPMLTKSEVFDIAAEEIGYVPDPQTIAGLKLFRFAQAIESRTRAALAAAGQQEQES